MNVKAITKNLSNQKLFILFVGIFMLLFANAAFASTHTIAGTARSMLHNLSIVGGILEDIAIAAGLGLVMGGFFRLKLYGQMRGTFMAHQVTIAGPIVLMLSGALLLIFPTVLSSALFAFWGTSSLMAYSSQGSTSSWYAYVPVVIMFVRVVGVAAFMRGIMMLSRSAGQGKQPGTMSKALLHMVGGVLCINVVATHQLFASLLPI